MARKFSFDRGEGKLAGVCATLARGFNIDPIFVRIGFVASAFVISWQFALIAYGGLAIYFAAQRRRRDQRPASEFERMELASRVRPSVHAMRTELDPIDRRLMAIDAHIAKPNHELAREIDALREDK